MNVYDTANKLAKEIKESKEYKEYKKLKTQIEENPETKEQVENFEKMRYSVQVRTLKGEETLEEGTKREIKEEFGIDVEIIKKLYEMDNGEQNKKEYFFLCKYIDGKFGTGTGPEFSGDPKYAHRGKYLPEIIKRENIENIPLLPTEIKEKFVEDIKNNRI